MADEEKKPAEAEAPVEPQASNPKEKPAGGDGGGDAKKTASADYIEMASKYGKIAMRVAGKFAGDMFKSAKQSVSEISEDLKKEKEQEKANEDKKSGGK